MSDSYKPQPLPPLDPIDVTRNHYWNYHNIEALLSCKKPLTASKDEDLFIAVHQICELAFNQMITDMERVLDALAVALRDDADSIIGDTGEACYFFKRILRLYEVVVTTMLILGTMRAFAEFRTSIGPTKCMQAYDEYQTRFYQAHLGLAIQQLKIVGVDIGTGGTSFRNYLAKYNKEQAPLFPGLTASSSE